MNSMALQEDSIFRNLRDVGETHRIYAIGDSHTLPFGRHFYTHPKLNKKLHIVTKYIPGFRSRLAFQNGHIDKRLIKALTEEKLFTGQWTPTHLATDKQTFNTAYAACEPLVAPSIIIFSGEIDLRSDILAKIRDEFDIDVEGFPKDAMKEIIDREEIEIFAEQTFWPLVQCITNLWEMGVGRIFLHCLPEPSLDDEMFFKINGYKAPWIVRKKCTDISNRVLRRFCAQQHIPFIDIGDRVTRDEKLAPEYELDGCHLAPSAYVFSIEKFLNLTFSDCPLSLNRSRWTLFADLARVKSASPQSICPDFASVEMAKIKKSELFDVNTPKLETINECPNLDWSASMRTIGVSSEKPSVTALEALHDMIFNESSRAVLEGHFGFHFQVINCRFRTKAMKEGELFSPFSKQGIPEHVFYGIMFLEDKEHASGKPRMPQLTVTFDITRLVQIDTEPDTLFVSRGNQPQLQIRSREDQALKYIDFFFMPRLPQSPPRVNWASENILPVDPFHFSVSQMVAVPEWDTSTERYNPNFVERLN